jgi:phosphonate transport system substrate-binding protein
MKGMDMRINRRALLAGFAAATAAGAAKLALAQSWRGQYPELVYAVVPAENATGVVDRYTPFVEYLSRELGTKVTLRVANDYAAVIEGQRAGNIHIGYYGPASFARARLTGVPTDAFVIEVNGDGSKGYNSIFYVLTKSPYQKIEDLKGKNLGLVDPNSTSGYNMPLYTLDKLGISPDTFFAKTQVTGSHENAVLALTQGTVDVAANWWNADDDSNLTRMLNKGMLKNADGTPMKKEDFRILVKSELIINSPTAMLSSLPDELKSAIRTAFIEAASKDKAAFQRLSDGKSQPFQPVDNAAYDDTIKLIQFVDRLRKKSS